MAEQPGATSLAPPEKKPTWKSTEFWFNMAGNVLGILVLLGIFSPEQASDMSLAISEIAGGIIVAVTNGTYAVSRGLAKKE